MSRASYWLSASVLTITSAPSLSAASRPGLERGGEALVLVQADDVVDAVLAGDLDGAVARAVVDDEPLDDVEARHVARQRGERDREAALLVLAGDLDDELHRDGQRYAPRRDAPVDLCRVRRAVRGHARRARCSTRRIRPTTPTTRCCGGASCSTASCPPSRASGRRPSTRSPSPSRAVLNLFGDVADRLWIFVILGRLRRAGRRRLPARGGRLHPARRRDRRAAAAQPLRLRLPGRARLHRHPVPRARGVGGRARGAAAPPRHGRLRAAARSPACCARRPGCSPASTGCGCSCPAATGHSARRGRRGRRRRPSAGRWWTWWSRATRCSR